MKKYLLLLYVTLIALLATERTTFAIPTWAESYGSGSYDTAGKPTDDPFYGSGFDFPVAIAKMPDGGFVVGGQIDLPRLYRDLYISHTSGASDAALVRFASDGTILWQIALHETTGFYSGGYFNPASSHIAQVQTDGQGNIFILGGKGNPYNGGQIPFVAKFSPAGQLVWQNGIAKAVVTAGDPPQTYDVGLGGPDKMGLTNDGGVVIMTTQGRPFGYTTPVIAKFDGDGTLSFYKSYEDPDQYASSGPICQTADGSKYIAIIRHAVADNQQGAVYGLGVMVVDSSSGAILAQRGFTTPAGGSETPLSLIRTSDGGLASLSAKDDGYNLVVRKFNGDASTEIFEKSISSPAGVAPFWPGNLSETSDGGFVIGGHTNQSSPEDAALMKVSATGGIEFVSVIGGPGNEGGVYSNGPSNSLAVQTTDGGYGVATTTLSYVSDPSAAQRKPDWWIAKTDANRHVRNFTGNMAEITPSKFTVTGSPQTPLAFTYLAPPGFSSSGVASALPTFVVQDLGAFLSPDMPIVQIQASSPRIVSSNKAEAIVDQHFAYHTLVGFFPADAHVTFSASGLPQGFVVDAETGVISGIAHEGSETTTPILITVQATDGTDTAALVLSLTIGDGAPLFSVNGSDQPAFPDPTATPLPGLADKSLTFVAKQPGALAGRVMRVQASTTPANEASWQPLPNGTEGFMAYDAASHSYVLSSTNYPLGPAVYFRARLRAPGRPNEISNVVGPFDLASNVQHLGTTNLFITRNGPVSNIRFGVTEQTVPAGISVRIQSTKTPGVGESWVDVPSGALQQDSIAPNEFYVGFDDYPAGEGIYFRALAQASNYIDSVSGPQGPFTFIQDPAATVTLSVQGASGSDGSDFDFPIQRGPGSFNVTTNAQSGRLLKRLALMYDGDTLEHFDNGATTGTTQYNTNVAGDHIIEAVAIDDLGVEGDARPVHLRIAPASPGRIFYITAEGKWNDPSIWIDGLGDHGVPGSADFAVLGSVNVLLTQNVQVNALSLNGGTIGNDPSVPGTRKITVTGFCTLGGGRIMTDMDVLDGATLLLINDLDVGLGGRVTNAGRLKIHGKGGITGIPSGSAGANGTSTSATNPNGFFDGVVAVLKNIGQMLFHPPAGGRKGSHPTPTPAPVPTPAPEVRTLALASLDNSGGTVKVIGNDGNSLIGNDGGGLIGNDGGGLIGNDGGGLVDKNGNKIVAAGAGNAVAKGVATLIGNDGGGLISNDGGGVVTTGGPNLAAFGAGNFISPSSQAHRPSKNGVAADPAAGEFVQNAGEIDMSGILINAPVTLNGGLLSGSGVILGDLANNGAIIAPGHSPGSLAVTGNFAQASGGTLFMEAAGAEASQFDQIQAGGSATLGGKLVLRTIDGYVPLAGDPFVPIGAGSVSGGFSSVGSNVQVTVNATGVVTTVDPAAPNPTPTPTPTPSPTATPIPTATPTPTATVSPTPTITPTPSPTASPSPTATVSPSPTASPSPSASPSPTPTPTGRALNISTRMHVLTGDKALIGGFIITGPSGSSKKVMIRGMGPSLSQSGISGVLSDPFLELHLPDGSTVSNDDWAQAANKNEIPSGFTPQAKESVIIASLTPGAYTVIESGAHGETGVGLTEVYDLEQGSAAQLANISTRGYVESGDNVMIGGFIVGSGAPAQLLLKGTGPSLKNAPNNLTGVLEDPTLELVDSNGNSLTNDNWRETQEQAIIATTVAPKDDKEPAILATLAPGSYTAILRGKNNTTGIAVVEAYKIK